MHRGGILPVMIQVSLAQGWQSPGSRSTVRHGYGSEFIAPLKRSPDGGDLYCFTLWYESHNGRIYISDISMVKTKFIILFNIYYS